MNRSKKEDLVQELRSNLDDASLMVIITASGLSVGEMTDLRFKMREQQAHFKVVKNTLAKIAVKDQPYCAIGNLFKGEASIAYSKDPIAAAKVLSEFIKTNEKVKILGGYLDGKTLISQEIDALSKLPSKDELRAKILATIMAPAQYIARIIKEPSASLVRVIKAKN